ncbi:ribonucleoside-diphosphate reductase, alpha subunit [Candidatus Ruthia magnifica str. Cm (Calyptogena magnifica)]|uniref:Ribonucleoside-diphosphate reductase n=1 Tax=Ruthia magnifica subsp. Calyptogena magnifica TaxID=413404 RepID=A1AWH0_RUTMC|nr:class 1a ribonucleoside-diphosphate reductase subunit alpha [Candidatus Ruthturnera calyptogenae]ABL02277.1 ribonucleoside-diphosphate reductase, alpha subunit [Candidatus Ruthia magnifica str. Cm (Calyptogena magnifica)]
MNQDIKVIKRNGQQESIDMEKIHRVVHWASQDLKGVSVSQVEINAQLAFFDGIKTEDIHETIIKSAADLISIEVPDYQYLAARLTIFHLRKKAFKSFTPTPLFEHIKKFTDLSIYDKEILNKYSKEEIETLGAYIDHWRDMNFSYAAVKQLEGKYLVQNRVTGEIYESPQLLYVLIGMYLFQEYEASIRMDIVKRFYDAVSLFKISLPTPIMAGVRTPIRQFSSCVLIEVDDDLDSISAGAGAIVKYVSQRAGIGINGGKIRAIGSPIRGGEAIHTGCIPFYKHFHTAVKSCSQGGVRGGAATLFYPLWHLEVESLLVLKNNTGTDENRIRHLDYGVQFNGLMYQRFLKDDDITLFSPHDVPGLYDAFFANQEEFKRLYEQYEQNDSIRKQAIKARELFAKFMQERANTGRIYLQNVDHCNTHSAFDAKQAPIKQSNLCMEITLPTKPLYSVQDEQGEVALCTLSAVNLGALDSLNEMEALTDIIVRSLDCLLDYQDYPIKAAELSSKSRRTLGIGVTNLAYYLAKNGVKYSDGSGNQLIHKTFEALQYYSLKASNTLAKELGVCPLFSQTQYSQGIMPIDSYKKDIDAFCDCKLELDWDTLRQNIKSTGLRNSTLTALMPCESSSQISNSTNGIEPPRGFVSIKQSKDGILKQIVPEYERLKNQYELLWDIKDNEGYLQLCGIMQKFVDQSISTNMHYDPSQFEGNRVPMKLFLMDLFRAYKYGIKTLYYHTTRDGGDDWQEKEEDNACADGVCKL